MPYLSPILSPAIPASLAPYLPATTSTSTYHASQLYAKAKMSYGSAMAAFDQIENALLLTGVLAPAWSALFGTKGIRGHWTLLKGMWDISGSALAYLGRTGEIKQSLIFVAIMTLVGTVLSTPKAYWKAFVLEDAHGFNKMTRSTFWVDQVKGALLIDQLGRRESVADPRRHLGEQDSSSASPWNSPSSPESSRLFTGSVATACSPLSRG